MTDSPTGVTGSGSEAPPPGWPRRVRNRLVALGAGLLLAVLVAEVALRLVGPASSFPEGEDRIGWTENTDLASRLIRTDPELGYVPRFGTMLYDERGLLRDPEPVAADPGAPRVLYLGDSVTARRFLELAVRRQCDRKHTSWNAGVEGYNTEQEVGYYLRHLRRLGADHVVLTLHNNDFLATPVVFYDDEGRIHCRTFDREVPAFRPWLFRHSHLYRLWFSWRLDRAADHDLEAASRKMRRALQRLRDTLAADGARLTVLVLPILSRPSDWSEAERLRHERALQILSDLGVTHVDLTPALERALADGVEVLQTPNDTWHPSRAVAGYFAESLLSEVEFP